MPVGKTKCFRSRKQHELLVKIQSTKTRMKWSVPSPCSLGTSLVQGPPDSCPRLVCISTGRPVSCLILSEGGDLPRAQARCGQVEPMAAVLHLTPQRLGVGRDRAQRRLRGYSGASGPPHPLTLHIRLRGFLCCLPASWAGMRPRLQCCSWGTLWALWDSTLGSPRGAGRASAALWWPHRPSAPFQSLRPAAQLRRVLRQGLRGLAERGPQLLPRVRPGVAGARPGPAVAVWSLGQPAGQEGLRPAWWEWGSGVGRNPDLTGRSVCSSLDLPGLEWCVPGALALNRQPVHSLAAGRLWALPGSLARCSRRGFRGRRDALPRASVCSGPRRARPRALSWGRPLPMQLSRASWWLLVSPQGPGEPLRGVWEHGAASEER